MQRINPDGTLPWGINGMDFDTNMTDYEQETEIAFSPGSQYIWSICTYTNTTQSQGGEFVQKFDKDTGARQFTDNAKEVYPINDAFITHTASLHLVQDRPIFLVADNTYLNAVLLDSNGDFEWTEESKPVATFNSTKSRVHFNAPFSGQLTSVFVEDKGAGTKIYAQNFTDSAILSVEEFASNNIQFVNPIQEELVIHSDTIINKVAIYNILGQLIYTNIDAYTNELRIDSQSWKSGIYVMTVTTTEGTIKGLKILK